MFWLIVLFWPFVAVQMENNSGILYPRESETREVVSLDGLWNFRISKSIRMGYDEEWFAKDLSQSGEIILMPVPSSYNDVTQEMEIRNHVGLVWYDRKFFVSESWSKNHKRIWIRFSSVSYAAQVWINGQFVMAHEIGHLPFQKEITSYLNFSTENRITVACDNTLGGDTIPQGTQTEIESDLGKVIVQGYSFDFYNYAGIDRPVTLFTTPDIYIDDITIQTNIEGDTGLVDYTIVVKGIQNETECDLTPKPENDFDLQIFVELLDKSGSVVAINNDTYSSCGKLIVPVARFWWPYLMNPDPGYLYTMRITLKNNNKPIDVYRQPVGIRTLKWDNSSFLINGRPVYMYGFGKHEDSDIRGKGLDLPLILKDYNLIKWIGANAFRTSHYPYADEIMDLADRMGIMVIDECPSVDTDYYKPSLLKNHKSSLTQLIRRDKNRPSVVAWSIANEPKTQLTGADDYFGNVAKHVRALDKTRPVTMSIARGFSEDKTGQHLDIISFNRYNAWYSNAGRLDLITQKIIAEARNWRRKYNKPVLMSEYGADTLEGLHIQPEYIWSEEYQVTLFSKHFQAFDELRKEGWFIGEFIWNFADFKTAETYTRVGGNKKGIFTRNRQPKSSAHHVRRRYWMLSNILYNAVLPKDLYPYEIEQNDEKQHTFDYIRNYSPSLEVKHKSSLTQLVQRDRNRPSVIAWSIANEPRTQFEEANNYFGNISNHVRSLDDSRPITMAIAISTSEDKAGQHLDIISFNRYNAWYHDSGRLDIITRKVLAEAKRWRAKYNKPVLMSEYGADTYEGLHIQPEYIWSEEYQVTLMSKHFKAFDELRKEGWFIGEFIWNFADFKTAETYTRVGGNKKGIFTRNRQPKSSAHHLRRRYWQLSHLLHNAKLPKDLHPYEIDNNPKNLI